MIGCREREVIVEKFFQLFGKCQCKLGTSVIDYFVIEAKVEKDLVKEKGCNTFHSNSFLHGAKNHPLSKPMVNHDQKGIEAVRRWEIND